VKLNDWPLNDKPSGRLPIYTRSNASEVLGAPLSPLGWTAVWRKAFEPGSIDGYIATGGFEEDEFLREVGEVYGAFGGYFYLNLSAMLILMDRLDGSAAQLASAFDDHPDMPKYERQAWYVSPTATERLAAWKADILAGKTPDSLPILQAESFAARKSRPDLSTLTDDELVGRIRDMQPPIWRGGEIHVIVGIAGLIAMGQLQTALASIGRANDLSRLCSTGREIETADIAKTLWTISRLVRRTPALIQRLERGFGDGLGEDIDHRFNELFGEFMSIHGSRGDNEWDLAGRTFETTPANALTLIASMAKQADEADPSQAQVRNAQNQQNALAAIRAQVSDDKFTEIHNAIQAVDIWFAARERSKNTNIRFVHEVRMACEELASRAVRRGVLGKAEAFYMLLDSELEPFIAKPDAFASGLQDRLEVLREVALREPPFIVNGAYATPESWPKRKAAKQTRAVVGEKLSGVGCSPGRIRGRARIILDASDPGALEPGDILVTRTSNPSWTPLFLVAGGVVTELGLFNSHASIVSRELGVPCVVSVVGATNRIPDGALIDLDGDTGAVEIVDV
jgi:pyruvate,water dikinase